MKLWQVNSAVCESARGMPNLQNWLNNVSTIPGVAPAIEGIYLGQAGTIREELPDFPGHFLVMGWCYGSVEYAYVS
jgi:hypothetical protein